MSDLYRTDTLTWVHEQTALLRRLAAGEQVSDKVDWPNIIEEIEAVGRSEVRAATLPLTNALQHKLYLLGWPNSPSARRWKAEIRAQLIEAVGEYRPSMRQEIESDLSRLYRLALARAERHMLDQPATVPLPPNCPWILDELLAEGRDA